MSLIRSEIGIIVPLMKLVSPNRGYEHWAARTKRAKDQRYTMLHHLANALLGRDVRPPFIITITRIGPRTFDGDNLQAAAKHVRDGIADALGIDDKERKGAVEWIYSQKKGDSGVAVKVQFCSLERDGTA